MIVFVAFFAYMAFLLGVSIGLTFGLHERCNG